MLRISFKYCGPAIAIGSIFFGLTVYFQPWISPVLLRAIYFDRVLPLSVIVNKLRQVSNLSFGTGKTAVVEGLYV